jgi:hypothetical protein
MSVPYSLLLAKTTAYIAVSDLSYLKLPKIYKK